MFEEYEEDYSYSTSDYDVSSNGTFGDCLKPFSQCWCEQHPNPPKRCNNVENVSIDSSVFIILLIFIAGFLWKK
jgi:hypothetical protein